jgi:hypothetical protein
MCHAYYYHIKCQGQRLGFKNCNPLAASPILYITEILSVGNQYLHGVVYGENSCLWGGGFSMIVQVLPEDSSPSKLVRSE